MGICIENLASSLASILNDLALVDKQELEKFLNSEIDRKDRARRMLRGLLRTGNTVLGYSLDTVYRSDGTATVVPSLPGVYVIDLIPLSTGGFDNRRVWKMPVVAWRIDRFGYVTPIIPGTPVFERWAVLLPEGWVLTDQYSAVCHDNPLRVEEWLRSEVEWAQEMNAEYEFWTPSEKVFLSGPVPRALWSLMRDRQTWSGSATDLLDALLPLYDDNTAGRWPEGPRDLLWTLSEIAGDLAAVGVYFYCDTTEVSILRSEREVVDLAQTRSDCVN